MTRLTAEPSCINSLLWRYELPDAITIEAFAAAILSHDWCDASKPGMPLLMLDHVEGHKLLVVTSTRRIQLRLLYMTDRSTRPTIANAIGVSFDRVCEELLAGS